MHYASTLRADGRISLYLKQAVEDTSNDVIIIVCVFPNFRKETPQCFMSYEII